MQKQQGRHVTVEQIAQIQPGMSEDALRDLLGSPDFKDSFHPDTWYYMYTNQRQHLPRAQNKLVLHFEGGKLKQLEGDYSPPKPLEYTVLGG